MTLSILSGFERRIGNIVQPGVDRQSVTGRTRAAVALAAVTLMLPLALLRGQPAGSGDLSGSVTDPSGARVPNAQVTVSGSSGNREVTRADAAGEFSFSGIPAGTYTVEVAAPGFAISTATADVVAGRQSTIQANLALGKAKERISVTASGQARHAAIATTSTGQIRVGGNVQPANLIRQVKPAYPPVAKAEGIEGTVLLDAVIGKDGSVLSLKVVNTLVDPDLASAAMNAVQQWRFRPTLLNGEPVELLTTITVDFRLTE